MKASCHRSRTDGVLVENHTLERTEALAGELGVELGWRESVG